MADQTITCAYTHPTDKGGITSEPTPYDRVRAELVALGHPEAADLTDMQIDRAMKGMHDSLAASTVSVDQFAAGIRAIGVALKERS